MGARTEPDNSKWIADGVGAGFYFVMDGSDTYVIAQVPVPIHDVPWSQDEALKHRALIASAPNMLAVLDTIASREGDSITGRLARAAAARARGLA